MAQCNVNHKREYLILEYYFLFILLLYVIHQVDTRVEPTPYSSVGVSVSSVGAQLVYKVQGLFEISYDGVHAAKVF